jgi:Uma2 family endonuclease
MTGRTIPAEEEVQMTMLKLKAWTDDDYLALPEGGPLRYEVIDGEVYMPPASNIRHQRVISNLHFHFRTFLNRQPIGEVFLSPCDVIFSHTPLEYVEPDLVFVSKERSSIVTERNIQGSPDIVVEILLEYGKSDLLESPRFPGLSIDLSEVFSS